MRCTLNVTLRRFRAFIAAVEKQIIVTYSGCVLIAVGIQHAIRKRVCMCGSIIFFHMISQTARFRERKKVIEHKIRVLILSKHLGLKHFTFQELSEILSKMYICRSASSF